MTDTDVAARAAAAYSARFHARPEGLWAAPGRVNLIGEHTDYNEGFVLPFALPERVVAAVARADEGWTVCSDFADEPVSFGVAEASTPGAVEDWGAYVAGVVWALRDAGFDVPPARIALASDVPVGAGLSSSHALECAVLTALVDLGGIDLPIDRRPQLVQRTENVYVGAPTGIMDQSASIRCTAGNALFLDCRSLERRSGNSTTR
jgi:galactokinase